MYAAGKLDGVEDYLISELLKNQPRRGEFSAAYITALYEMGIYFRKKKKYIRSRDWFKLLRRIVCAHIGADSFEYAVVMENIASTYELAGEFDRALYYYLQTLKIYKTAVGVRHSRYTGLLIHVCRLYCAQGDYKAALHFGENLPGVKGVPRREGSIGLAAFCSKAKPPAEKEHKPIFRFLN
jgi:tetratricopeptide (TPR) repeat protein